MVVVRLIGGLGNQMFQYAFGRNIALIHGVPLKLDISGFKSYPLRKFELKHLNIAAKIATERDIHESRKLNFLDSWMSRIVNIVASTPRRGEVCERFFHFDPAMLTVGPNAYLNGYWQSEKYFEGIEDIIRQEFTFQCKPDARNEELLRRISTTNSVSLHVRRGDYVSDPVTHETHGTCPPGYYQRAVELIAAKIGQPHIFVFSDTPEWVKNNLSFNFPSTLVIHNSGDSSFEDLRLTSHCKHHIIANSSFSWWGAWLNSSPEKIVIAPKKWFANEDLDSHDLIPPGWIRL